MATLSFFFGTHIIIRALIGDVSVEGWASLMVSMYFIGGLVLFVLGLVGTYVGKIYNEVKARPLYVVESRVGFPAQD